MRKDNTIYSLALLVSLILCSPFEVFACDFDGDGRDDPAAYVEQADGSWTWTAALSGGGTQVQSNFGNKDSTPAPGAYYGASSPAVFGYITKDFFWTLPNGDRLNFGRSNVTYYSGRDFTGDGIADLLKFPGRCNKFNKTCATKASRGNFALNKSDGTNTFIIPVDTASGIFGKGLDPLFAADRDGDGTSEVCYARPKKNNPKVFKLTCKTKEKLTTDSRSIGRIFAKLMSVKRAGGGDYVLVPRVKKKASTTELTLISPNGESIQSSIPATGEIIVGDWTGAGSQQVGVVSNGTLTYVNPFTEASGTLSHPTGTPVSCHGLPVGPGEKKVFNSRNVCKVFTCK